MPTTGPKVTERPPSSTKNRPFTLKPLVSAQIEAAFGKFLRGLAHMSGPHINAGYRELYELGTVVVPALEERIYQADWKTLSRPEATHVQTTLVRLLHDIDEARSRQVIAALLAQDCDPVLRRILQSIRRYDSENFDTHEICNVSVYLSKAICDREGIPAQLARWLANVPAQDLAGITRLYIVPDTRHHDEAGYYMPAFSTITLYWNASGLESRLQEWLACLWIEKTLYHEIGHHALGHSSGQQPEQEKEADRYAHARLRTSRPVLAALARIATRLLPSRLTGVEP